MSEKTIFLCGGQGSQYFGMGQSLFVAHPVFRDELCTMDQIAQQLLGRSVVEEIFSAKRRVTEPFDDLLFSHPAILMIEIALARALKAEGITPDLVVGASLGELAALVIGGALSPEMAVRAAIAQAQILISRCEEGGMISILDDVALFHREAWLHEGTWLAAVSFERHFVVSGTVRRCDEIERCCKQREILFQRLPVRRAFHSPSINGAQDDFLRVMEGMPVGRLTLPVFSATQAKRVTETSPQIFWRVVREPIQFVAALEEIERTRPRTIVDLSPGGTLSTFVKHHFEGRGEHKPCFPILTPFKRDVAALARLAEHYCAAC